MNEAKIQAATFAINLLIEAIKEQQSEIDEIKRKINE